MIRTWGNVFFLLISAIGLLPAGRYLLNAWQYSAMDSKDWIFFLLGTLCIIITAWHFRTETTKIDFSGIPAWCAAAGCLLVGIFFHVNWLLCAGAIALVGSAVWILFSWTFFLRLAPGLLLLFLALPGSTLIGVFQLQESIFGWKIGIAVILLFFLYYTWRKQINLGKLDGIYGIAVTLLLLSSMPFFRGGHTGLIGKPYRIQTNLYKIGTSIGAEESLTAAEKQFFRDCRNVHKMVYHTETAPVGVLVVESGDDIHAIHPPRVCLLTANWVIDKAATQLLTLADGSQIPVEELQIHRKNEKKLHLSSYVNGNLSTGDYFMFRNLWNRSEPWRIIQLSTPLEPDEASARNRMIRLLDSLINNSVDPEQKQTIEQ